MHPRDSHRLRPRTPVWVWVVRLARGRWWPGTVEGLRTVEGHLRVAVRFECKPANGKYKAPVAAGITTTSTRYVELRNIDSNGLDQPAHAPVSLLECPEELASSENEPAPLSVNCSSSIKEGLLRITSTSNRTNGDFRGD
jgi:hypothetical protein